MENNLDSLIVIESLPKIKQRLQIISDEVDKEIELALSMECTEENKTEVKKARTRLNSIKTVMEGKRKQVKQAILAPYEEFEEIYDKLVKNKLNEADNTLKTRISTIEEEQLKQKKEELEDFVQQYFLKHKIDFCSFEEIGLKITLSASMKSLQEQALAFINNIVKDLTVMAELPEKEEVFWEYKNNAGCYHDLSGAINVVRERKKELEFIKEVNERKEEEKKVEQEMVSKVEEIVEELTAPVEIETTTLADTEETFIVTFSVKGTKTQLRKLKDFMNEEGMEYEGR